MPPTMQFLTSVVLALALGACASTQTVNEPDSDAPEARTVRSHGAFDPTTYDQAIAQWQTPEDVNEWIGARFEYDSPRALLLSETQRVNKARLPIHAPEQFFKDPRGICVDLARFAVESLRNIAPDLKPTYVMIEFDPISIGGNVLRRHWVTSFKRAGMQYFFADSKRPGHIAGPYATTSEYIAEYSQYRRRQIVAFKDLPSYRRQMKVRAKKNTGEDA
jgi:hypothetical protein